MAFARQQSFWNYCFPLFRFMGYNISVHWTMLLFLLIWLNYFSGFPGLSTAGALLVGFGAMVMHFGVVLIHEIGHGTAARRFGYPAQEIKLGPLGGLIHTHTSTPRHEMIVTAAGPLVHPLLMALSLPFFLMAIYGPLDQPFWASYLIQSFFYLNLALLIFNGMPAYPMDGGRVLRAALSRRIPAGRATIIACHVSLVFSIGFIVYGILTWNTNYFWFILVWIGAMNIWHCEQVKHMVRHQDPYGEAGPSYDLSDYYKQEGQGRRKGFFERWAERRQQRREERRRKAFERRQEQERKVRVRVDELLDKVNQHGLQSLSPEERDFLNRASKTYRHD